jgi:high-affinity nickel permease
MCVCVNIIMMIIVITSTYIKFNRYQIRDEEKEEKIFRSGIFASFFTYLHILYEKKKKILHKKYI